MPVPFAPVMRSTAELYGQLQAVTRASSTPQTLAFRCRIILRVAQDDQPTNGTVAAELGCRRNIITLWRTRFLRHGLAGLQDAPRSARRSFPPDERLDILTRATERTAGHDGPATRWTLDDLARELVSRHAAEAVRRSAMQRILHDADLQPHRSVYWLNSHDPDVDAKAAAICDLYVRSPRLYRQGELVISTDEKTGMQILERKYPTRPAQPGHPEKREHESIRHGTRALVASFVVPTGEVVWNLGPTRTSIDFANHLTNVADRFRDWSRITWVVDGPRPPLVRATPFSQTRRQQRHGHGSAPARNGSNGSTAASTHHARTNDDDFMTAQGLQNRTSRSCGQNPLGLWSPPIVRRVLP